MKDRLAIAKIIDPDAHYEDLPGIKWSRFDIQRRDLALSKADTILELTGASDDPYHEIRNAY